MQARFLVLLVLYFWSCESHSYDHPVIMPGGNVVVGGGYATHAYNKNNYNKCGKINDVYTIVSEAHLFFTQYINDHLLNSTGLKLGAHLVDSCNNDAVGIQTGVQFIKNITHDLCYNDTTVSPGLPFVVTGGYTSAIALEVNYLLQAYCIPLVATQSSSMEFDTEELYPYFLRTVSSDRFQVETVVKLLHHLNFTRITVIYESSVYGTQMKDEFERVINNHSSLNICSETYNLLSLYKKTPEWDAVLCALSKESFPGPPLVVVLFLDWPLAQDFFHHVKNWTAQGHLNQTGYQYIGVDGWSSQINTTGIDGIVNNSITVEYFTKPMEIFETYISKVTLNSTRNRWLRELIRLQNHCAHCHGNETSETGNCTCCRGNETLAHVPGGALRRATPVFQALALVGKALLKLHKDSCVNEQGFCAKFSTTVTGCQLHDTMKNLTVNVPGSEEFQFFNNSNSGPPRYVILQYQGNQWAEVGHYIITTNKSHPDFHLPLSKLTYSRPLWAQIRAQQSNCTKNCTALYGSHSWMSKLDNWQCCHMCHNCNDTPFHYIKGDDLKECTACPTGQIPADNHTACVKAPDSNDFYDIEWAMVVVYALAGLATVAQICSLYVFIKYRRTPMAQAGTVDLQLAFCVGLICLFLSTGFAYPSPSMALCTMGWVSSTLMLGFAHAIMLVKSIRLARPDWFLRLFQGDRWTNKTWSKLLVLNGCLAQFIVVLLWSLLRFPKRKPVPCRVHADYRYSCSAFTDHTTLLLFCIPGLYLFCTILLLRKALKSPYLYVAFQTRFLLFGSVFLIFFYGLTVYLFAEVSGTKHLEFEQVEKQFLLLMSISLIGGISFWFTMSFPVLYVLVFKRKTNKLWSVKRKRAQLFREGNVISIITPQVYDPRG